MIVLVGFLFLRSGMDWLGTWQLWVFVVAVGVLFWFMPRGDRMSAGADWVDAGRHGSVRTYDLVSIDIRGTVGSHQLILRDRDGGTIDHDLNDFRENPFLWDLVFNGIRHSLAGGAEITPEAHRVLQIGEVGIGPP
ncbi:hypothetical protein [Saccharomonospora sp. CUA-673]|uniref:hypothetical protein n=1 Tax=Saccharomonospora sp. CUA-673 TaxID=1904969 RepID=UPI0011152F43|nr:hypothetical protein [Saccharomonospora sp. CUA-673]